MCSKIRAPWFPKEWNLEKLWMVHLVVASAGHCCSHVILIFNIPASCFIIQGRKGDKRKGGREEGRNRKEGWAPFPAPTVHMPSPTCAAHLAYSRAPFLTCIAHHMLSQTHAASLVYTHVLFPTCSNPCTPSLTHTVPHMHFKAPFQNPSQSAQSPPFSPN